MGGAGKVLRKRQANHGVQPQDSGALLAVGEGDASSQRLHDFLANGQAQAAAAAHIAR